MSIAMAVGDQTEHILTELSLRAEIEKLKARIAELEKTAKERPDIERAKELLMFAFKLDGHTCHELIRQTAMKNHVSLFVVAQWVIQQLKAGEKIVIERERLNYH